MPLNEGQTIQYTVTTTNTADGTVLYWRTTGNVAPVDIVGSNTGTITIINNRALINVTTVADLVTDGTKTLGIAIATGSQSGPIVATTTSPVLILDTSGTPANRLYTWGRGDLGALGQNDTVNRSSPTQVGTEVNWSTISLAGFMSTFAIKSDNTLWFTGVAGSGGSGLNLSGFAAERTSFTQVGANTTWSKITQGTGFSWPSVLAIKTDGTLWAWGKNDEGQLGLNNRNSPASSGRSSPVQVGANTNWSLVSASDQITAAIKSDGTLWTWGANRPGSSNSDLWPMLGRPSDYAVIGRSSPTQVGSSTTWSKVSIGVSIALAIKTDGTLWTWGGGNALGLNLSGGGLSPYRSSPTQIGSLTTWSEVSVNDFIFSSTARGWCMALRTDGTLWMWGHNSYGVLGLNGGDVRSSPTQVGANTNWTKISAGERALAGAIKSDGTLWAWGRNIVGPLGLNDEVDRSSPTQVGTSQNWSLVSMGYSGAAALTNT
jgi:alpha-tubulin suppressor-like RCC1 family protein